MLPRPILPRPRRARRARAGAVLLCLLGLVPAAGAAQAPVPAPPGPVEAPSPTPEPRGPADDFARGTPRSSVRGYLEAVRAGDFERAAQYLDLRRLRPEERATRGPELAARLAAVLEQTLWIDPAQVSAEPLGDREDGLASSQELLGKIETSDGTVDVLLARVPREDDGVPIWKVSSSTVRQVPALYEEFGYGKLGELLPRFAFEVRFFGIQLWQWVGIVLFALGAVLVATLLTALAARLVAPLVRRSASTIDDHLVARAAAPVRLAIAVLVFSAVKYILGLGVRPRETIDAIEKALLIVAVTWVALRAVDALAARIRQRLLVSGQGSVVPVVQPGARTAKVVVVAFACIVALDNFGFNVTALIAGLGVGGIAVALAAQKSLENVFGAIALFTDQPVRVGDFCRFGDRVGTVEEIGLRSTRIRTLDRTVVAVPNTDFAAMQLENFSARDKIWYHPKLALRYDTTPEQVRYVLVEVRRMLYAHPRVDPDPARIRFLGFGPYALELEIFAYVRTRDFGEYLEIAEDLNLRIMDIVAQAGTAFALPSQTTYLEPGSGADPQRRQAAERAVEEWRRRGALYLPGFPPEAIAQLRGTLDYPPPGSPMARGDGDGRS